MKKTNQMRSNGIAWGKSQCHSNNDLLHRGFLFPLYFLSSAIYVSTPIKLLLSAEEQGSSFKNTDSASRNQDLDRMEPMMLQVCGFI